MTQNIGAFHGTHTFVITGQAKSSPDRLSIVDLPGTPSSFSIQRIEWTTDQPISISWEASQNDSALVLAPGYGSFSFPIGDGVSNPMSDGATGDLIVAPGAAANYTIYLSVLA